MVLVVIVTEEEYRLYVVASQHERLVGRDGRGNTSQSTVGNQDNGESQRTVEVGLRIAIRAGGMDASSGFDEGEVDSGAVPDGEGVGDAVEEGVVVNLHN